MSVKDNKITYQMKITYDEVSQEDYEHPVVLVVEWRDTNGKDLSEHIILKEVGSSSQRISRVVGNPMTHSLCGTGCKANGKKMLNGEVLEERNLCILLRCDGGEVVVERLDDCGRKDNNGDNIVFPSDFS